MAEIWERQKGERDTSYIYFHIFLHELKITPKKLKDVINYIESLEVEGSLRKYKSHLIDVPTLGQLQKASAKWKWQERETAYINHLNKIDEEKRNKKYNEENNVYTDSFGKDLSEWDKLSKELEKSEYSLSTRVHLKLDIQKGKDIAYKNYRLGNGRSISISESNDKVKVDGNIEYGGFDKLVKALDETRKQYKKQNRQ
jgi:hypothetical protein